MNIHNFDNKGKYDNQKRDNNVSNHGTHDIKETSVAIKTR